MYFPELLAPLLRSLLHLTSPPFVSEVSSERRPTRIVISYKIRSLSKETPFWAAFGLWFSFEPVLVRNAAASSTNNDTDHDDAKGIEKDAGDGDAVAMWSRLGSGGDDELFIFIARRRPESLTWNVPLDDAELLAGVEARGDQSRKSDDTFETLLLMALSFE